MDDNLLKKLEEFLNERYYHGELDSKYSKLLVPVDYLEKAFFLLRENLEEIAENKQNIDVDFIDEKFSYINDLYEKFKHEVMLIKRKNGK